MSQVTNLPLPCAVHRPSKLRELREPEANPMQEALWSAWCSPSADPNSQETLDTKQPSTRPLQQITYPSGFGRSAQRRKQQQHVLDAQECTDRASLHTIDHQIKFDREHPQYGLSKHVYMG
jgi:hypothetical protein